MRAWVSALVEVFVLNRTMRAGDRFGTIAFSLFSDDIFTSAAVPSSANARS